MPEPDKIMLIRHGEKPEVPPPAGVTEDGGKNKHALIVRGWQRAGALVAFFEKPTRPKISTPATIVASATSNDPALDAGISKSLRPAQTVSALVAKLNGVAFINDIAVGNEPAAIAAIKGCDGVVLVSWEHKRIPTIAQGFIAAPPDWGDRFDAVWVLDRQGDGSYVLTIINQDLLYGDLPA
jgi:hypothetical protein